MWLPHCLQSSSASLQPPCCEFKQFLKSANMAILSVLYPLQCFQLLYSGLQAPTRPLSQLYIPPYTVPHTHSCMERLQYSMWRCVLFLLNWKTV